MTRLIDPTPTRSRVLDLQCDVDEQEHIDIVLGGTELHVTKHRN